ncbi:MAG: hypothetical protein HZC55_18240 [Verrucomicrobia bacterium]|nr:hypothetical protein [Verrucomicrobiota bacterium]
MNFCRRQSRFGLVFGLGMVAFSRTAGAPAANLRSLYEAHEWFRLREAVLAMPVPPEPYRAVVAAAFHEDATADHVIREILLAASTSWEAREAQRHFGPVRLRREFHHREPQSQPLQAIRVT